MSSPMFFRELVGRFEESGVDYCIVGGMAVNLHGIPRMTYDIDLVVAFEEQNLKMVDQIITGFGLRCQLPLDLVELADEGKRRIYLEERHLRALNYTDPNNLSREVDVLVNTVVPPDQLIDRAIIQDLDGVSVKVISIDDLIALKSDAGRKQDLSDLEHLRRISEQE